MFVEETFVQRGNVLDEDKRDILGKMSYTLHSEKVAIFVN